MVMNPFTLMVGKEPYLKIPRRNIVSASRPHPLSNVTAPGANA